MKVRNAAGVTAQLKAESENALPVFAAEGGFSRKPRPKVLVRQNDVSNRWLDLVAFDKPPLRPQLSGLELEYRIIQLYSRDAGKREAKISFNVGQGTQDIGFRNDVDILFNCLPSTDVILRVLDEHGKPATASFLIRDAQGAVVGFAHSGFGLAVNSDALPNYEMPKFDGIGANEYVVDVAHDAVDFISTVDTPSVWELNIWYHTLNCGYRTCISGETDFPCIYGDRVGLGRVYARIDGKLDYDKWVDSVQRGRTYVSDGKSHLMDFRVNGLPVGTNGSELKLGGPENVKVNVKVSARLDQKPNEALRALRYDKQPYWDIERARIGDTREVPVELIVNGEPVARRNILADGSVNDVVFDTRIERSSWVAVRILPTSHTNPIFLTVGGKPIRASRKSAEWCLRAVDQCWSQKLVRISAKERADAEKAYDHAREAYKRILAESDTR